MRVMFLLTTVGCRVKAHHPTGFLSAVLKEAGHQTAFLELPALDRRVIDAELDKFKPEVFAASTVMQQFPYVRATINYVKKRHPHIKTVLGGTHAILKPGCIEEIEGLDAICISEGEGPLLEFVRQVETGTLNYKIPSMYFRVGNEIVRNPNSYAVTEEDMARFPIQDRTIFARFRDHDRSKPLGWRPRVLWGRGCPYACTYCSVPSIRKIFNEPLKASKTTWVRYPPVEKAIQEIETLRDQYIFDTYVIDDDVFTTRKPWIMEWANKYPSKLKDKVHYEANLRVESVDKEIMQALKDTGCTLLKFGLENGNYDIRRKILKRPIPDEKIIEVFNWAHEVGIPAHTFNIVGIPGETKETIWQTINLNRKIRPARIQVTIFFPYFGTPLGDQAREKGLVVNETDSYFSGQASVKLNGLTGKQVERYAHWMKFLVYSAYDKKLAWQQIQINLINPVFSKISTARQLGIKKSVEKLLAKLKGAKSAPKPMQVETMGSDGERPIPPGIQELEDQKIVAQYDIEDWDVNNPHMDTKAVTQVAAESEPEPAGRK